MRYGPSFITSLRDNLSRGYKMVTKMRILKEFESKGKHVLIGLPGMGRVGYASVNYILEKVDGDLVAELYSTTFPSQLMVSKRGLSTLFVGRLYDAGDFLMFTSDTQPQSSEGQHELCMELLDHLVSKGRPESIVAAAAYVVPEFSDSRKVFIAGNDEELIQRLSRLGGSVLEDGVITGVNGVVVGWASYYDVKSVVALGETWSAIVEFNEVDYRAVKSVVDLLRNYLGLRLNTEDLIAQAELVESRIQAAITQVSKLMGRGAERRESREIM
ncbi:MAG: PAC2 family protein [Zestosphaera sp.]